MKIRNVITATAISAALAGAFPVHAAEPVKIGFMAVLSGPQAALGQDMLDAFMMVVDRNGGKLGGVPVEIIRRDTQLKPEVANQIADELIQKEKTPIVTGFTFSNIMMGTAKKLSDAGTFVISSNAGPAPIAGTQCNERTFVVSKQNDQFAEAIGLYATRMNYKKIITLAPNYQAGKDYVSGFKRTYKAPVVDEIYTPLTQLDFSAEISRIMSEKPDAVYAFYPGGLGVSFVRAYQQSGLMNRIPLLSISTVDGTTLPALKDAAIGALSASAWGPDLDNAANKQFVADFTKKFKRIPSEYAAQAYDSALLLDSALAKTKGNVKDAKAFSAALKAADFKSVRGNFKFNNNNYPIQDVYVFSVAKDSTKTVNLKTVQKVMTDAKDAYHQTCKL